MLGMTYHNVPQSLTPICLTQMGVRLVTSQAHFGGPGGQGLGATSNIDGTRHRATVGAGNSKMAFREQTNGRSAPAASWEDIADRMILITLPARMSPYKLSDLEDAVLRTSLQPSEIETLKI